MQRQQINYDIGSQHVDITGGLSKSDPFPSLLQKFSRERYPFLPEDIADYILGGEEAISEQFFSEHIDRRDLLGHRSSTDEDISANLELNEDASFCNIVISDEHAVVKKFSDGYLHHGDVQAGQSPELPFVEAVHTTHPSYPREVKIDLAKHMVTVKGVGEDTMPRDTSFFSASNLKSKLGKQFHSQPIVSTTRPSDLLEIGRTYSGPLSGGTSRKDNFYFFKTTLARLEKQISRLHSGRHQDRQRSARVKDGGEATIQQTMSAGRYFDALKGPELDILKDSEEVLLPLDKKWPFLLRFPIGCFGISLGLGSQTILWKALATTSSMSFLHIPRTINLILWCLAVITLLVISTTYSFKCIFYFEAVRREYFHPVRINFFFAPWIACMFLTIGIPPAIATSVHPVLWCLFMTPIFILELKIYGQWLSGGKRRLSKVANPSTHLSLVGNFVGALLASKVGWNELAIFFWAVGFAHYLVLFVTLYQRLPTAQVLPKELHPVFFLFVAVPSTASIAWENIVGDFDFVSRIAFFVGLFLYTSLVVRLTFFCGFRFSVSWWAYTFPMTASSIAAIHYSDKVTHPVTQGLAVILSLISSLMVLSLFFSTILHFFLWHTMFPNDLAIAITPQRPKRNPKPENSGNDAIVSKSYRDTGYKVGECASNIQCRLPQFDKVTLPTI